MKPTSQSVQTNQSSSNRHKRNAQMDGSQNAPQEGGRRTTKLLQQQNILECICPRTREDSPNGRKWCVRVHDRSGRIRITAGNQYNNTEIIRIIRREKDSIAIVIIHTTGIGSRE